MGRNNQIRVLAALQFPLSLFTLLLHLLNISEISFLGIVGTYCYLSAGVLFLIGSIKDNKKLMNAGFIIGFFGWNFLIMNHFAYISLDLSTPFIEVPDRSIHMILGGYGVILGFVYICKVIKQYLINRESVEVRDESEEEELAKWDMENFCPNCQELIQRPANFCHFCGQKVKICKICEQYITNEEQTSVCPFCKFEFHKSEFLEWLKVNASCPVCKNEIDLWEFQKLEN